MYLQAANPQSQEPESKEVDFPGFHVFQVRRVLEKPETHQDRRNANRKINVEDPTPGIIVRKPPPQGRPRIGATTTPMA